MKARDKFWLYGVRPGQDDYRILRHPIAYRNFGSHITPTEAAVYLNVPNMIMVNARGIPVPGTHIANQYAFTFTPMKKVLWSVGSLQHPGQREARYLVELSQEYPNFCGAFVDDFMGRFHGLSKEEATEKARAFLQAEREVLAQANRQLELYVACYIREWKNMNSDILEYADGLTVWTENSDELVRLEDHFVHFERLFPDKKMLLGIQLFDACNDKPVPLELMEHQCELGLRLLKEGRAEGLIFQGNAVMGVGFPTDAWTREWISRVGDTEVPD